MGFWIVLTLKSFRAPPGVDPAAYNRVIDVASQVEERLAPCFAGAAWLKRRFPARSYVNVYLSPNHDSSVSVEILKTKSRGGGGAGPREIRCHLRIPPAWFHEAGDALIGLRLLGAVLHALSVVGDHYGIGMPAARTPRPDPDFELRDPFRPPPPQTFPFAEINAHLDRLAASIGPDQLLLVVKEPASTSVIEQCRSVQRALGLVVEQQTLIAPEARATAWTIQMPS